MATPAASLTRKTEPQSVDTFIKGLWRENPVFVALLGMCPVLAVTNSVINALAIGLASTFVVTLSSTMPSPREALSSAHMAAALALAISSASDCSIMKCLSSCGR